MKLSKERQGALLLIATILIIFVAFNGVLSLIDWLTSKF